MKKFGRTTLLVMIIAVVMIVTSCTPSSPTGSVTSNSESSVSYSEYPDYSFSSNTVKLMANWMSVDETWSGFLKDTYGLEIDLIKSGWTDIPTKLATYIMSNDSPDMVLLRPDLDDYPRFIINELVQPIDDYVDLNHPIYEDLLGYFEQTEWNGKNYILLESIYSGVALYYNKKIFNDYGLELPWDLYKSDEWDWNKFRELALELKTENEDGTVNLWGFCMQLPFPLVYTAGVPFGSIDGNNKTIVNNIQNPDIARAANFLSDLVIKDRVSPASIDGALGLFKNEQVAMMIAGSVYQMPEVTEIAKAGNLGIVPVPKDPQADDYYMRGTLGGWFIPLGAKNPEGASAASASRILMGKDEDRKNESFSKMKEAYFLTDENIEQLNSANEDGIKKVLETTAWIGYDSVWLMVGNLVNWDTQVATDLPRINARITEIFEAKEFDPPTGPKVIDSFESYDIADKTEIEKYTPVSGGDLTIKPLLSKDDPKEGNNCLKIEYSIGDTGWCGTGRSVNKTWRGNDTMRLWIKGDGEPQVIGLQFITAEGAVWSASLEVESNEWEKYEISIDDFTQPEWISDVLSIDLTDIRTFNISFGSEEPVADRYAYFDMIEVIKK